jgi:chromosome segregation ATPase
MMTSSRAFVMAMSLWLFLSPESGAQASYDPAARMKNARELIDSVNKYQSDSQRLHAQIEKTIQVAEKLKGQATDLEVRIDEGRLAPHLTGGQLKAAQAQYAGDVKAFQTHAQDYANHLQQFKVTVGECSANKAQYAAEVNKFQLHTEIFHIPNIRPPHICGALNLSEGEASHIANQMANDQGRLQMAEQSLSNEQQRLNAKMSQLPALQNQVLNENRRALEEKKLAEEFGRLKAEYETLSVEHAALVGKNTSGKISSESVTGKINRAQAH